MRVRWGAIIAVIWLAVVLVFFTFQTHAAGQLSSVRIPLFAAAALWHSIGFLVFGMIWTILVRLSAPDSRRLPRSFGYTRVFPVSLMSLAGLLTPMNIGTDVLRSLFGKTYLGLPSAETAAASIATRESKLHVALALLPAIAAAAGLNPLNPGKSMGLVFAGTAVIALVFYLFRTDATRSLSRFLGVESLANATRELNRKISWKFRILFYFLFALGFSCDWRALHLCFLAFGMTPDLWITFAGFGILFFLSRTPIIPLGIGVVETGGYALLRTIHVPVEQAGALIIAWGFLRVTVPSIVALFGFVPLLFWRENRPERPRFQR